MPDHRGAPRPQGSIAPYNFVPLPERVLSVAPGVEINGQLCKPWARQDRYLAGAYGGWLDLEVVAETPVYVRCGPPGSEADDTNPSSNQHRQQFFHHGDPERPVVPGSSLRGMIRALVEIIGFGKMQWLDLDKQLVYRAVGDSSRIGTHYRNQVLGPAKSGLLSYPSPRLRGGYLKISGDKREIIPAREWNGESFVHVEYSASGVRAHPVGSDYDASDVIDVWIKPPSKRTRRRCAGRYQLELAHVASPAGVSREAGAAGLVRGKLVRSGHMDGGHPKHMHCVVYDPDDAAQPIPIPLEKWQTYESDCELSRGIENRKLEADDDPLFYLVDDNDELVFFGPTMMLRLPYEQSIGDLVPVSLRNPEDLDLAEAIFGTVDRKPAIRGRVLFEDMTWNGNGGSPFLDGSHGLRSPKILSGPKPTAFQHYLEQPVEDPRALRHWDDEPGSTRIRGHKRYWHRPELPENRIFEPGLSPGSSQHTIVRPVRKGTRFIGRIRFENMSLLELGALLTAIRLDNGMRHHLGMGKPLGMGSVKITSKLHLVDRARRYQTLVDEQGAVISGALGQAESDQVAAQATATFRRTVLEHAGSGASKDEPTQADLWRQDRLSHLAAMLQWGDAPDTERTGYRFPDECEGRVPRWWRGRPVLPSAVEVANPGTGAPGRQGPAPARAASAQRSFSIRDKHAAGEKVRCKVLETKTKKGGWKFEVLSTAAPGVLHPESAEPPGLLPGQELDLIVKSPGETLTLVWSAPDP